MIRNRPVTSPWLRRAQQGQLAALGQVQIIDQRAHGESAAPRDPAAYPEDVMALDMAAVLPALGLGSFDLVGYSMGARLAAILLERVARLRELGFDPPEVRLLGSGASSPVSGAAHSGVKARTRSTSASKPKV